MVEFMPLPEKIGFLFPGQGAQYVGMGADLYARYSSASRIFDDADRILGYALSRICFEGPEEKLTQTLYAQPAIYVTSMAVLEVLREFFPTLKPAFAAGLSLGEFSALAAAGTFDFQHGLELVRKRAEAMEFAAGRTAGTMASVIGLSQDACESIVREAGCELANLNAPDQFVFSGATEAVERACQYAEAKGAKRAIRLKVGGAFHSSLMREAKDSLEKALSEVPLTSPAVCFVPNVTAEPVSQAEEIKKLLALQLTRPVQWIRTMSAAKVSGTDFFLEIGPGKVLKGLAKRCEPSLRVEPCGSCDDIFKLQTLFVSP